MTEIKDLSKIRVFQLDAKDNGLNEIQTYTRDQLSDCLKDQELIESGDFSHMPLNVQLMFSMIPPEDVKGIISRARTVQNLLKPMLFDDLTWETIVLLPAVENTVTLTIPQHPENN